MFLRSLPTTTTTTSNSSSSTVPPKITLGSNRLPKRIDDSNLSAPLEALVTIPLNKTEFEAASPSLSSSTPLSTNSNASSNFIHLKIFIPSLQGSRTKKIDLNSKIYLIIDSLNRSIPPAVQSPLFQLYYNEKRLDKDKTLSDYQIEPMDTIELKRDPEFQLSVLDDGLKIENGISVPKEDKKTLENDSMNSITSTEVVHSSLLMNSVDDIKNSESNQEASSTNETTITACPTQIPSSKISSLFMAWDVSTTEAIQTIRNWLYPHEKVESCKLSKIVAVGTIKQEMMDLKEFHAYNLRAKNLLEFEATSERGVVSITKLIVDYSPIDDYKSMISKRKGDESPVKRASSNLSISKAWNSGTSSLTFSRISSKFEDFFSDILETSNISFSASFGHASSKRESSGRFANGNSEGGDASESVSLPYNVVHESHVDFDFQWTGTKPEELFQFKQCIGQGAYGSVWLASHRKTNFELAVKVVPMSDHGKLAIEKEVEILKKCKSPYVLFYYGTCSKASEVWILMDYCTLGSVKDIMKLIVEPLEEAHTQYICVGILKGLIYLHSRDIIHLDVKAANVMLTSNGQVKLGDFGVSEQLRKGSLTKSKSLVGSPLYMSPEVILANRYSYKADCWSLGITLIEMVEGRPPNNDISNIEQLMTLPQRPPPTLKHAKSFSSEFNDFLANCLVKDEQHRPDAISLITHAWIQNAKGPEVLMPLIKTCTHLKESQSQTVSPSPSNNSSVSSSSSSSC